MSQYVYQWLGACQVPARIGSGEPDSGLQVRVMGNPVTGNTVEVEIGGASAQPLQLKLIEMQGKAVHAQQIEHAGAVERVFLPLGTAKGMLLLQVSTPTQRQTVKVLKCD